MEQLRSHIQWIHMGATSCAFLPASAPLQEETLHLLLHPMEIQQAALWKHASRREEHLRARALARLLGGYQEPLLRHAAGQPLWPPGVRGSLSHKEGSCLVAVTSRQSVTALGLDLEVEARVREELQSHICSAAEIDALKHASTEADLSFQQLLALVFSAKEALFKAFFPHHQRLFFFHHAEFSGISFAEKTLDLNLDNAFRPSFLSDRKTFTGHWQRFSFDERVYIATLFVY